MVDKTGLNLTVLYQEKVSAFCGDCKADCGDVTLGMNILAPRVHLHTQVRSQVYFSDK
jgi:hypothetical protein